MHITIVGELNTSKRLINIIYNFILSFNFVTTLVDNIINLYAI